MSVYVLSEVWDRSEASGGELLVLLVIADTANGDGFCYPSINVIAAKSRLKKRQVIRVVDDLVTRGEIEVWKYRNQGTGPLRNGYQVLVGKFSAHRGIIPDDLAQDTRKTTVGPKLSTALRTRVLERFGYRCLGCRATSELQVDHIVPWSKGGPTTEENLQPLCEECNRRKGVATLDFRGCKNDTDAQGVWASLVTLAQVSPETPLAGASDLEVLEPSVEPSPPTPHGGVVDLDVLPPSVSVEGRNLPFDALCEVCGIDERSPHVGRTVAQALNGRGKDGTPGKTQGIRALYWLECRRVVEADPTRMEALLALQADGEQFARLLAERIRRKAALIRERQSWRQTLRPVDVRDLWLDVELQTGRSGAGLSPSEIEEYGRQR